MHSITLEQFIQQCLDAQKRTYTAFMYDLYLVSWSQTVLDSNTGSLGLHKFVLSYCGVSIERPEMWPMSDTYNQEFADDMARVISPTDTAATLTGRAS